MGGNRTALLFAAGAALLVAVVAASGHSPVPSSINDVPLERGLPGVLLSPSDVGVYRNTDVSVDPELIAKIIAGLVVVMAVLAVTLSIISFLRRRQMLGVGAVTDPLEGTVDTVTRVRLKDAVEQARDLLVREGGRPRDAVIEAWVTLENAADHKRAPHQTATEFTVGLLEKENADEVALRELRTLYQRARFSTSTVDGDSVTRARAALERILATIR